MLLCVFWSRKGFSWGLKDRNVEWTMKLLKVQERFACYEFIWFYEECFDSFARDLRSQELTFWPSPSPTPHPPISANISPRPILTSSLLPMLASPQIHHKLSRLIFANLSHFSNNQQIAQSSHQSTPTHTRSFLLILSLEKRHKNPTQKWILARK